MKKEIKFHACEHLNFSDNYVANKEPIQIGGEVKLCWNRPVIDESFPRLIQFCKKRGRMNNPECCTSEETKGCSDYNEIEHIIIFEAEKMKRVSPNEAKHIVLTYLMGYTSASMNDDCDFYEEIPHNYILDETKLESALNERFGMNNKEYYPNDEDIKVIVREFEKMYYQLLKQKQTCIKKYNIKNQIK